MGGIAVRAHGLPRPTFDVDFVLAVPRERLGELFAAIEKAGYTVPDHDRGGWVDSVGGMPLFKVRLFLEGRGIDVDVLLEDYMRRWAAPLGVNAQLEQALAEREG